MSMGRPLEFDPTLALDAAMQLFWRKGYEASSLQDLLATMGLSKSSFYQTFESKRSVFERALEHYRFSLIDEMRAELEKARSGRAFIDTLFHSIAEETIGSDARRGCLLMNTACEFAQTDADIASLVSRSIGDIADVLEAAVVRAQDEGSVSSGADARTLATYLVSSISGLKNMVKAGADRETIRRITSVVLAALD